MFDGKIDFMDFNKIKINYGGKLTCRKVFKKKYILFLLFSIILIIILICLYASKKSQISEIEILMKQLENEKSKIENSLNMI
jgi:sensor domain CHASE-containing protein